MSVHGDDWRTHLGEIFQALDSKDVAMGTFTAGRLISEMASP